MFAALMALGACNRSNPGFDAPGSDTWSGSGGTGGSTSTSSGSTSASGSSDTGTDDGGTGGTGSGGSSADDGGTSGTESGTGSSDTTSGDVWQFLFPNQDAYIQQQLPDDNHGTDEDLRAGSGSASNRANRLLVRFAMEPLQPGCSFSEASLRLYYSADGQGGWDGVDPTLGAYRLTENWNEDDVTWNTRNGNNPWTNRGGTFDPTVIDEVTITGGQYGWVSWDVTDTVMGWCQDSFANDGFVVRENPDDGDGQGQKVLFSREYAADPDLRPVLLVHLAW